MNQQQDNLNNFYGEPHFHHYPQQHGQWTWNQPYQWDHAWYPTSSCHYCQNIQDSSYWHQYQLSYEQTNFITPHHAPQTALQNALVARNEGSHGHFNLPPSSPQAQCQVPVSMQYLHHDMAQWQSPSVDMLQGELASHSSTQIIRKLLLFWCFLFMLFF